MQFLHAWQLYPSLPMKNASTLPVEGFDWMNVPLTRDGRAFPLKCLSETEARRIRAETHAGLVYRLIVRCDCGEHMPFAKMGQHYGSGVCKARW